MLVKKSRVGLLLVLVATLGFGLAVAAEDGSVAWPGEPESTMATQETVVDGSALCPGEPELAVVGWWYEYTDRRVSGWTHSRSELRDLDTWRCWWRAGRFHIHYYTAEFEISRRRCIQVIFARHCGPWLYYRTETREEELARVFLYCL